MIECLPSGLRLGRCRGASLLQVGKEVFVGTGRESSLALESGSRVAVIGGGPAGSFFSYFVLDIAYRVGLDIQVDIYEPRNFSSFGPAGCNMSGCIISEPLVQMLAAEGINLPPGVVRRGIDSYLLHMDVGNVRIETPLREMRIASVHRGAGPRGMKETKWRGFDGYMLELAVGKGANLISNRIEGVTWDGSRPQVRGRDGVPKSYDLLVGAFGVNTGAQKLFEGSAITYLAPATTKSHIREFLIGEESLDRYLGSSIHIFLPHIPRLDFACLIPKGDFATMCLLGEDIDEELAQSFMKTREFRECLPPEAISQECCRCYPRLNIRGTGEPYADRVVFIGDSGITRLYKDGIGAAYRTAKAAAVTAVFHGISAGDFRDHYWPVCQGFLRDNRLGRVVFTATELIQKRRFARRGLLRTVSNEQKKKGAQRRMSMVLWDTFTGSAPYREVFKRTLHPGLTAGFLGNVAIGCWPSKRGDSGEHKP